MRLGFPENLAISFRFHSEELDSSLVQNDVSILVQDTKLASC